MTITKCSSSQDECSPPPTCWPWTPRTSWTWWTTSASATPTSTATSSGAAARGPTATAARPRPVWRRTGNSFRHRQQQTASGQPYPAAAAAVTISLLARPSCLRCSDHINQVPIKRFVPMTPRLPDCVKTVSVERRAAQELCSKLLLK